MNIRNISLSLLLLVGISQSSQAMQGGCIPTLPAMLAVIATTHPVATTIVGTGYVGYKTYQYLSTPKPQK